MQDLNDLYFFVQVVEHQGFAPAGRALGMPKSTLSRRIAQLEERLGVRLIQRSTRRFAVTEIGQDYYRHCVAMLVEANAAQDVIERHSAEPQGTVRLACPTALLDYQLGELLARFMVVRPKVQVHLESTNRRVDVIGEGFDIAIRVRFPPLEDTDLVMRVLGESTQCLVASPDLLQAHGLSAPLLPADLSSLPSLDEGPPHREHMWSLRGPGGAMATVSHHPRLISDDRLALRMAALHGVGVLQLPTMMVRKYLERGLLVDLLPDWQPRPGVVHAVFPSRRGLLPAVRELIDYLAAEFARPALAARGDQTARTGASLAISAQSS
ncbi:LysR family transcriptional regulator [Acidovorax carolinensis]|uniref:LysR family transcriptional regulator n=1 Tax=Acidovorax carolinensis TaxID=553814 RepID=A0A240TSH5_9BURK|nr:LysR family transcriptional regulator [Acidovorax carolinensis]ART48572.1 LysR family transcriptional regulator [Acidovorax carolinensis]ART54996.1 LysR family transcriptional regulator [Acidovorax carolinensis]ART59268.1 LysR family transcriptional regulator [Acidovorax carolinensis]